MRNTILVALVGLAVASVSAEVTVPHSQRIVGGALTTINQYPYAAVMLYSWTGSGTFNLNCGSTIINNRSVLTAAHCFMYTWSANQVRIRVGSSYAHSGGSVLTTNTYIIHSSYNSPIPRDNDIAIIRVNGAITSPAASIAGANYNLGDNQPVWVIGWGDQWFEGPYSEQLRHVQVWVVNQTTCRNRYAELGGPITDNMMCAGWLDVGGRDGCQGDSGGPVIHNGVIVGVTSWGQGCAHPRYPGVNVRVSRYTAWIQSNA